VARRKAEPETSTPYARLTKFVEQSRYALQHSSLAQQEDLATLGTSLTAIATEENRWSVSVNVADFERLGYVAGSLRPFMMNESDAVYLTKVLADFGRLASPDLRTSVVVPLTSAWKTFPKQHYFSAAGASASDADEQVHYIKDRQIAVDWIHGRFTHVDSSRAERVRRVGDHAAQQALTLWVKDSIALVRLVQVAIQNADDARLLR